MYLVFRQLFRQLKAPTATRQSNANVETLQVTLYSSADELPRCQYLSKRAKCDSSSSGRYGERSDTVLPTLVHPSWLRWGFEDETIIGLQCLSVSI